MQNLVRAVVISATLIIAWPVAASPWDDALDAYQRKDYSAYFHILVPLAQQGNAQAQHYVADLYFQGNGVPQDYEQSLKWERLAAVQGYAPCPGKPRKLL